jgi:hypothetical protein
MSHKLTDSSSSEQKNSNIVHKPFATGTVNFFTPHKNKSSSELSSDLLLFDNELESSNAEYPTPISWKDKLNLFSSWKISAVAIFLLVNITSGAIIIARHKSIAKVSAKSNSSTLIPENFSLGATEFIPLELGTLSKIQATNLNKTSTKKRAKLESELAIPPSTSPFNSQYYYVLTEYSGDRSLVLAKEKVKNVSLVNFPQGMFIYLGAFATKEKAEQFVKQLDAENISAYIYPFE